MTALAALYGRQSKDKQSSVDQQLATGEADCAEHGWGVFQQYRDGISASRFATKARPDWDRLMADLEAGRFQVLWLWEASRGDRDLPTWVTLLAMCRVHRVGIYIHTHDRLYDMTNARDWKALAEDGMDSAYESEKTSLRVLRDTQARAEAGRPHGRVAYGWERGTGVDILVPAQAEVIRDAAERLLAGETLRSVASAINAAGHTSPNGLPWSSTTLRQVMLRDKNAGLRRHRGKVIGKGNWEPIYDEDTHVRVVALLTDPDRRKNVGATRRHLGTMIYRCGLCDGTMRVHIRGPHPKTGEPTPLGYQCSTCWKLRRKLDDVDALVNAKMIEWLNDADAVAEVASGEPGTFKAAKDTKAALEARLELAADDYADGSITGDQLKRITAKLLPQIEQAKAAYVAAAPQDGLARFLDADDIERAWYDSPLDVRRDMIKGLLTVTILPVGRGARFGPDSVRVELTGNIRDLVASGVMRPQRRS